MKNMILLFAILFFAAPSFAKDVLPARWTVDPAASAISFSGTNSGREFSGTFKSWTADIVFDPASLETSSVSASIDTGSARTGEKTYDGTLPTAEWFNVKAFPAATFESKAFRQTGDTTYEVDGTLAIKGISQDITLPFTLTIEDGKALMEATTTLDRLLYKIGAESDPKGDWVSKDITVTIKITAARAP
jgi:cytochrome b561